MKKKDSFLWCEAYRPQTIQDTILPKQLKNTLQSIIDTGEVPNMIFTGTAGLGKTTAAKAICDQLDLDYIVINGSEEGNIDTLRGKIRQFASSVSLQGGYKVVILDEADYLNPQSTQPALRGFIEEFSNNCRFILTCNFRNRIIAPLHSRCGIYDFNTSKKDLVPLAEMFYKRFKDILENEKVSAPEVPIVNLIMEHAPDWRRVLNEGQKLSIAGSGVIANYRNATSSDKFTTLYTHLKSKNFKSMRRWVVDNVDIDSAAIFRGIYDNVNSFVSPASIPQLVIILADYQYKDSFVADHELNIVACMIEIMDKVDFK